MNWEAIVSCRCDDSNPGASINVNQKYFVKSCKIY